MMKQFILTLAIYMAIISSAENENSNINYGDLIVHIEKAEFMDNIGTVSEGNVAKAGKVMEAGAYGNIFNLLNENIKNIDTLRRTLIPRFSHLDLTSGEARLMQNSSGNYKQSLMEIWICSENKFLD